MKFAASLLMMAISFGAGMSVPKASEHAVSKAEATARATSGPYRDGLYLGKLAAVDGAEPHISNGRWARGNDQLAFAAGYEQGYRENK